jgi:hypothetical protein
MSATSTPAATSSSALSCRPKPASQGVNRMGATLAPTRPQVNQNWRRSSGLPLPRGRRTSLLEVRKYRHPGRSDALQHVARVDDPKVPAVDPL